MRRAIALVLGCIALSAAGAQASASNTAPALQVRSITPFTVRGVHFVPRERVRVTLDGVRIVRVRANLSGAFTAAFPSATIDPCDGYVVKAVGRRGSVATYRSRPRMCVSTNPG